MSQPVAVPAPAPVVASKPWWKSKTVWFGLLEIIASLGSIPIAGPTPAAYVGTASGVAKIALRVLTTEPVTAGAAAQPQPQP